VRTWPFTPLFVLVPSVALASVISLAIVLGLIAVGVVGGLMVGRRRDLMSRQQAVLLAILSMLLVLIGVGPALG
jgi:hypothetical protein